MTRVVVVAAAALLAAGCGGGTTGTVRGRLVENGQPVAFPPGAQAAVVFSQTGADGQPDRSKVYTMMLAGDGAFELVASGGELPVGPYRVTLDVAGAKNARFKGFSTRREVRPGDNVFELDLTKPDG